MSVSDPDTLDQRVRRIAGGVRAGLIPIVREIQGEAARPTQLARTLSLDKNLTSRILRAIRNKEPLGVAHQIPAPQGLRIFVSAARKAGVTSDLCDSAEERILEFERLIEEQAGGRTSLEAAISGWLPDTRRRGERGAMQATHKAMCYLLGYQVETRMTTHIVQPSADGECVDRVDIIGRFGLRRLRSGSPITVAYNQIAALDFEGPRPPRLFTLDGRPVEEGQSCAMEDYCTRPLPELTTSIKKSMVRFFLPANEPPINEPVSLVFGNLVRDAQLRYRTEDQEEEWLECVARMPCRAFQLDVFVRDDVWPGAPTVTPRLYGPVTHPKGRKDEFVRLDQLDLAVELQPLGTGSPAVHSNDVEGYSELLGSVFDRVGWDRSRFRGYRVRVQYAVPFISYTMWFDLPERPGGAR